MFLNKDDVKAYLSVLGYYTVGGSYSGHIVGCLCRLKDQLSVLSFSNRQARATLDLLQYREKLNGYLPQEHPQLQSATKQLAVVLKFYLDHVGWSDEDSTSMNDELDYYGRHGYGRYDNRD